MSGSSKSADFSSIRRLHLAILLIFIVACVLSVMLIKWHVIMPDRTEDFGRNLQVITLLLTMVIMWLGFRPFSRQIPGIRKSNLSSSEKWMTYRRLAFRFWAAILLSGIFALISFLLNGNMVFFIMAAMELAVLILFTPRKDNMKLLLGVE
ncbi:MAG TPA: hypothetical protein VFS31_15975 [Chitinophagaceae bacterium]|nr:hypothetical protein [Chitinophagaceae bacterium]